MSSLRLTVVASILSWAVAGPVNARNWNRGDDSSHDGASSSDDHDRGAWHHDGDRWDDDREGGKSTSSSRGAPVPEPSKFALFGLGAAALLVGRKFARR
jgi:hypothetical protein